MGLRTLFPTLLYESRLPDPALVADLEAAAWMLEDGDTAGADWCATEGYPGYTSYASLDDLPTRATAFALLKSHLDREAEHFAHALGWDMAGFRLELSALWVNILAEGGVHPGHIHPGSVISGTVYVAMPEGASRLRLEDPRLAMMMAAPQPRDDAAEAQRRFVYLAPAPGDVLMWESWLRHEVTAHESETPRVSISFNYGLLPG